MKDFDINNVTRRSNLEAMDSLSEYMGHAAQQNPNAYKVFYDFLKLIRPERILEIGTGLGGFTYFLRQCANDLDLDTNIMTFDVYKLASADELIQNNIDVRIENIFDKHYTQLLSQEVIDYVQLSGITVVLCDGVSKIGEFRLFSKIIKEGDFIFAHDYARDHEYFMDHVYMKLWNWHEMQYSDIKEACEENELSPFMEQEFQEAVWTCRIKRKPFLPIEEKGSVGYLIEKYGSDKKISGYTKYYDKLFYPLKEKNISLLEAGVGTFMDFESQFAGVRQHYPYYLPGGSLRAWRDYFTNGQIYGIDLGEDCLIEEERIKTYICNCQDKEDCNQKLGDLKFDIIIDDALHDAKYQLETLKNLFPYLNDNGYYIVEDTGCGGYDLLRDHKDDFLEIVGDHAYACLGRLYFIKKNYSKIGRNIDNFEDFLLLG